jgi:hypothetical protein
MCLLALAFPVLAEEGTEVGDVDTTRPSDATTDDALSVSSEHADESSAEESSRLLPHWIRGTFESELDAIIVRGGEDFDFSHYLRLDVDPPEHPRIHIRVAGWLQYDLGSDASTYSVLRDINDTSDSDLRARLSYLYVDFDDVWGDSVLRLGRQRIREGIAYNRIDGIYFRKRASQWEWYVFGGARASLYWDTHDDLALGGGVSYRPNPRTRIAVDGYYGEDSRSHGDVVRPRAIVSFLGLPYPRAVDKDIDDSLLAVSAWHSFSANHRAFARIGWRKDELQELILNLNGYIAKLDVLYDVGYEQSFDTIGDSVNDISRYYRVLGGYSEYQRLHAMVHRPLTERTTLSLEAEIHEAESNGPWTSNRDYQRVGATLYVEDVRPQLDAAATLEYWNVEGGEGSWTLTGEVSREWEKVDLTTGIDYVRYKDRIIEYNFDFHVFDRLATAIIPGLYPGYSPIVAQLSTRVVDTRENVYSLFTDVDWAFRENQELYTRFSYESDDGPESPYWRIRLGYRLWF